MSNTPALLFALSDPGDQVTEAEFHDWYDNEHVPLRVDVPAFTSWRRVKAIDPQSFPWAAFYDVASYDGLQKPPYTTLAETRSEREKSVLSKLKFMERRVYELLQGSAIHLPSAPFDEKRPSPFVIFIFTDVKSEEEEEHNKWYDEEHAPLLLKVPGCLRIRRFVLKEWDRQRDGVRDGDEPPAKYLSLFEFEHLEGFESEEHKYATSTPWREKVVNRLLKKEQHVYAHYKAWERE